MRRVKLSSLSRDENPLILSASPALPLRPDWGGKPRVSSPLFQDALCENAAAQAEPPARRRQRNRVSRSVRGPACDSASRNPPRPQQRAFGTARRLKGRNHMGRAFTVASWDCPRDRGALRLEEAGSLGHTRGGRGLGGRQGTAVSTAPHLRGAGGQGTNGRPSEKERHHVGEKPFCKEFELLPITYRRQIPRPVS